MTDQSQPADQQRQGAEPQGAQLPSLYFNGFQLGSTLSDMGLLLMLDGQPLARLSMSFTTAKTLQKHLSDVMHRFEELTSHKIMTMDEVQSGLNQEPK